MLLHRCFASARIDAMQARATASFEQPEEGELAFQEGAILTILPEESPEEEPEWWMASDGAAKGLVPRNYLQV